jgi:pimeloyl-ACP methyl ester carboxylesterase
MFRAFLPEIATDRSVYAPDAPGCGESDAPADKPTIGDLATAMSDFVESMRFRQIDVLGYRTGALVAAELAILLPEQVRRLVLVSVPALSNEEREAFRSRAQPSPPAENGSHLQRDWEQTLRMRGPAMTLEMCEEALAERLYNGPNAWWGAHAAHHYAAAERLPLVRQPALVIRPKDELWEASARARQLVRGTRMVDMPEQGFGVFSVAPAMVARHVREFLS